MGPLGGGKPVIVVNLAVTFVPGSGRDQAEQIRSYCVVSSFGDDPHQFCKSPS